MNIYSKLTKKELKKLLEQRDIKYPSNAKKEELIKLLKKKKKATSKRTKKTIKLKETKKRKIKKQEIKVEEHKISEPPIRDDIEKYHPLPDYKFLKNITYELPYSYNFHKLGFLVVNPYWIYAYWEIKEEVRNDLIKKYGSEIINPDRLFLKVYEITNEGNINCLNEIKINSFKGNWFININRPESKFVVKLGFKDFNNNFIEILSSNVIKTPRDKMSDNLDQIWAYIDIDKPLTLEIRKHLKKHLKYQWKMDLISSLGPISGSNIFFKK